MVTWPFMLMAGACMAQPEAGDSGQGRLLRGGIDADRPMWGIEGGIRFAIWPAAADDFPWDGGPRGLIRVAYPILADGAYSPINFVAIEPIVEGQRERGFSELEPSERGGRPGKWIEAGPPPGVDWEPPEEGASYPGHIELLDEGEARLTVCLRVEHFRSGAHVYVLVSVRTDRPDELELQAFTEDGSEPLAACILTATMGNFERLRELHLIDRVVTSHELYGDYEGVDFAPHQSFALEELPRAADGSVLVAATTDEEDPSATQPDPSRPFFWNYAGAKVTQYWRKPPGTFDESLCATVNARRVYWASKWPIPEGVSFENFELDERFVQGQTSVFGVTRRLPGELTGRGPEATQ